MLFLLFLSFCLPNRLPSICLSRCGLLPCCSFLVFSPLWPLLLAVSAPLATLPPSIFASHLFRFSLVSGVALLGVGFAFSFLFLIVYVSSGVSDSICPRFLLIFSFCFTDLSVSVCGSLLFFSSFGSFALASELRCLPCVSFIHSLSRKLLLGLRCSSSLGEFLGCLILLSFPFFSGCAPTFLVLFLFFGVVLFFLRILRRSTLGLD